MVEGVSPGCGRGAEGSSARLRETAPGRCTGVCGSRYHPRVAASSLRAAMRARAFRVARRVASTALERLAREVDRLALALEPVREAIALQGTSGGGGELEVTRRADRRAPTAMEPAPPSREPPTRPTPSVQPSLGIAQATD